MNDSHFFSEEPSQRPAEDPSPPVSPLGGDHPSENTIGAQDPTIGLIAVIPSGSYPIRIY